MQTPQHSESRYPAPALRRPHAALPCATLAAAALPCLVLASALLAFSGLLGLGTLALAQSINVFPNVAFLEALDATHFTVDVGPPTPPGYRVMMVELTGVLIPPLEPECGSDDQNRRVSARAKVAKAFAQQLLSQAKQVDLVDAYWGPLYQLKSRVLIDGQDLGRELVARDAARPDDGSAVDWCQ